MSIATLTKFPASFTGGDTIKVLIQAADFPAPAWAVTAAFAGPELFTVAAVPDGAAHLVTLATVDTATRKPGVYDWQVYAEAGGERATIERGRLFLIRNAADGSQLWAEQMLALVEAHIASRLPAGINSHSYNGNQISKMTLAEALQARRDLMAEVARLRVSVGNDDGAIHIYFAR